MASGGKKRTRSDRVASVQLPPSLWERTKLALQRGDVLMRIGLCVLASIVMWLATQGWAPPFRYHTDYVPTRHITARVDFRELDQYATREAQELARSRIHYIYVHDPQRIVDLQAALKGRIIQLLAAKDYQAVDLELWGEFLPQQMTEAPGEDGSRRIDPQKRFENLRKALAGDEDLQALDTAIAAALAPLREKGTLQQLEHGIDEGSQKFIQVYPVGEPSKLLPAKVEEVRINEILDRLSRQLDENLKPILPDFALRNAVAESVYSWLERKLPQNTTLTPDREASAREAEEAAEKVPPRYKTYKSGQPIPGINVGQPLGEEELNLLRLEHQAVIDQLSLMEMIWYSAANFGMYLAMFTLCGVYTYHREPKLITDTRRLVVMLGLVVFAVLLCCVAHVYEWRGEVVPIVLLAMTIAVAYRQDLALLVTAAITLIVVLSLGHRLSEFVILVAAVATASASLDRVRSRTKLLLVGLLTGAVAMLTSMGVRTLSGQDLGWPLVLTSLWFGAYSIVASLLMTGLLPLVERLFDVRTDLSLLELGDQRHPLLQELIRRAPGTYNHSINVASIAESAADAIGANGLLVRTGAYFHDIGKMLKPGYFIENQGEGGNRHESLLPAMSTLVIIAHVKDGADLARQHHLPQAIIDFILQHHGTTLVEYFYREASRKSAEDPDGKEVDESNFRYPGPKPQTKEAAVMMLADAVESASRVLVDPGPARIESLVEELAMKRLMDGQFDECGLTLQELRVVERSLTKSLTAIYHGRIKYPDQATA